MKVKIIDILNRIAEGKNIPIKIKINDEVYIYDKEKNDYKVKHGGYYFFDDIALSNSLNEEVQILDNETNGIEEIICITSDENTMIWICIQKINELVKAINKLNNQDTSKKTNCMTD